MKRIWWIVLVVGIVAAIIFGVTVTDFWNYFLEFTKTAFRYMTDWFMTIIDSICDAIKNGLSGSSDNSENIKSLISSYFIR